MTRTTRFGVVGGYGATGRAAVQELRKSCDGEILIGGRDLKKGQALAAQLDGRVSAAQVDVLDDASLDRFCDGCSVVVNCGGPVMLLQDRVAQAAFRRRCHYVDVAGLSVVKEGMLAHAPEVADLGLSFVMSAGWLPGLTELLPVYTHAQARAKMDAVESLTVYLGDSGEWSDSAFVDMAWYLRQTGLRGANYFRKGQQVRARLRQAFTKVEPSSRVGRRRFVMAPTPELDEVGRRLDDCEFFTYTYVPRLRTVIVASLVALLPMPVGFAARLLRSSFPKNPLPVGGFVVAVALGESHGRRGTFTAQVVYDHHREYWTNGLVVATVARMISEGKGVKRGVHFLTDAVDAVGFLAELRQAGVEQTETFDPGE
jgi:hypothetical protein